MNNLVLNLEATKTKTALTEKHLSHLAKVACNYSAELDGCDAPLDSALYLAFIQTCMTLSEVEGELQELQRELKKLLE